MARRRGKELPLWSRDRGRAPGLDKQTQAALRDYVKQETARQTGVPPAARPAPWQKQNAPATVRPFRFRHQLMPVWWLAYAASGLIFWRLHLPVFACLWVLIISGSMMVFTRHLPEWPRRYHQAMAAWCGLWAEVAAIFGPGPWLIAGLAGWAVPSGFWVHKHRWRPPPPGAADPGQPGRTGPTADQVIFYDLAEHKKWAAWLGPPRPIENGTQYPIFCQGSRTHIGQIIMEGAAVAAAYDAAITTVYVERDPTGIESRGLLTRLARGTLDQVRHWDGIGIDATTGLAVVGRFPDGRPLHERVMVRAVPGGGVRHTIVAGADGSGKTGQLDLGLCNSAISGYIAAIVLDPQEGQALPAWRDHVPYAVGAEQCLTYLRGLHAAMMARSSQLAQMTWTDPRTGKQRRGMGFFDHELTGLPIIEITIDEAPILLALKDAVALLLDIAKLGRKAGFRLRLAAQVPSLAELKAQELRSMLVGGNVFCFRTADKVSDGMVNLDADPWKLPKYWPDGTPTVGLGYSDGPDSRSSVTMRTDWVPDPYHVAETASIRPPDDDVSAHLAHAIAAAEMSNQQLNQMAMSAASAQLAVLAELDGRILGHGELLHRLCSGGRWRLSEAEEAIGVLAREGRIAQGPRGYEAVTR